MKIKILFAVLIFFIIYSINYFLNLAQPEIASQLALEQFADPSIQTDTASRAYNGSSMIFMWGAYAFFVGCLFYSNFMSFLRGAFDA